MASRYYVFRDHLYKSQEGKDKKVRKATKSDKEKYGGIIGDIVSDIAETVSSQFKNFRSRRIGHKDYRKGGMVINTVDNRKNK